MSGLRSGEVAAADEVADLLDAGRYRHGHRPEPDLPARAQAKLAEVEAKIAGLQVIAGTLREALDAGCADLVTCAGSACCPIPFATLGQAVSGDNAL